MRRQFRRIIVILCLGILGIQFFRPTKNLSPEAMPPDDLRALQPIPEAVRTRLENGCYDCHSNNTRYPWYAEIQPFAWWLDMHVRDGKRELNFSGF
ncbi:MAG: heme-binding domain-containing protein, partial [Opitutaceae bacterium]|nr:heme-binding domain-containing protein [Opitutaceae bacterium]